MSPPHDENSMLKKLWADRTCENCYKPFGVFDAHARQMQRARREQTRLKTYLGRVIRDIEREVGTGREELKQESARLTSLPETARRIHAQQRHDKGKVYSVHAPEVECIAKGKAYKPYEFGAKVGVVSTSKESFIVGMQALPAIRMTDIRSRHHWRRPRG